MSIKKPVELGKASSETKETGIGMGDGPLNPFAQPGT
jgi:hypothetical protein